MRPAARPRQAGFTLIEVLVVLAIMVIVIAILLPLGTRQRTSASLKGDARAIAEALRLTRSRAITSNHPAAFFIDVQRNLYRAAGAPAPVMVPRGVRITLFTTADQTVTPTRGAIRFYPDGSASGGGVALSAAAGRYLILVDWLTGEITIDARAVPPPS